MNRERQSIASYPVSDFEQIKQQVLNWVQPFSTFCFLDNHRYQMAPHKEECLLAAGCRRSIARTAGQALADLQTFLAQKNAWVFGHLGYELGAEITGVQSEKENRTGFPDLFFFEPEILIRLSADQLTIEAPDPEQVYNTILATKTEFLQTGCAVPAIQSRLTREAYLAVIHRLREHIQRGDCYEINFCQEFFAEEAVIDPLYVYNQLCRLSPNPFSALYRVHDQWLLCASPERFIRKEGRRILSQPIKGTAARVPDNEKADRQKKEELLLSQKERAENVMVVDLVRNDLSRVCREGSVKVDELFGIYSFPQVHQMISTISGELQETGSFSEIIRACFPMGSMTGAPKKRVMELIEQYEPAHRGIFSGAVGYIDPAGDFDFNVVIRSIMYNAASNYLSFQAGSGITHYSEAAAEWDECQLKAAAIKKVLGIEAGQVI